MTIDGKSYGYSAMDSEERKERYSRREWLKMGAGAAAVVSAGGLGAAESRGKWTDESEAKYVVKLFDWLKADLAKRVQTLSSEAEVQFRLDYKYLDVAEDQRRARTFERYADGSLSGSAADRHVQACLEDFERVRQALAAQEAKAAEGWKAKMAPMLARDGAIFDTRVSAERLTVVLDSSPSMTPYLAKLRTEISRDFAEAYYAEVSGCDLSRPAVASWFYSSPSPLSNPFSPDRHIPQVPTQKDRPHSMFIGWTRDAPAALSCMVDLMKTDAIYWFCDFDDPTNDNVIKEFAGKVGAGKTKLFIHTLDRKPPKSLVALAEASGGAVVKKRI